jgi:hypothetical protein
VENAHTRFGGEIGASGNRTARAADSVASRPFRALAPLALREKHGDKREHHDKYDKGRLARHAAIIAAQRRCYPLNLH